jgi:hypothetical protein
VFPAKLIACHSLPGRFGWFLAIFDRFQGIPATFLTLFQGFSTQNTTKIIGYETELL